MGTDTDTGSAENILVIKLSALGDFMIAQASMAAIRQHHPKAHITLLTTAPFVDMGQRSGYFNDVKAIARAPFYNIPAWAKLRRFLNGGNFTRVYDLQLNDRTAFFYLLFRQKPEWSGVVPESKLYYPNPKWRDMHAFERHRQILAVAGIEVGMPDLSWMTSDVSLLGVAAPYVLFVPGSAPTWPQKRWPALKYGALGLKLMQQGYAIAVLGTNAERETIDRVLKSCPGAIDLCGKTSLYNIATLARGAAGAVGNDTGPTHLIAMSNCPTLALFSGATHPELSAPTGEAVTVLQCDSLDDLSVEDVMKAFNPHPPSQKKTEGKTA